MITDTADEQAPDQAADGATCRPALIGRSDCSPIFGEPPPELAEAPRVLVHRLDAEVLGLDGPQHGLRLAGEVRVL